jgi:hypothetical protein
MISLLKRFVMISAFPSLKFLVKVKTAAITGPPCEIIFLKEKDLREKTFEGQSHEGLCDIPDEFQFAVRCKEKHLFAIRQQFFLSNINAENPLVLVEINMKRNPIGPTNICVQTFVIPIHFIEKRRQIKNFCGGGCVYAH